MMLVVVHARNRKAPAGAGRSLWLWFPAALLAACVCGSWAVAEESIVPPEAAVPVPGPRLAVSEAVQQPESVADLRTIQRHVQELIEQVGPATVAVFAGGASASGVVISPGGLVLTAAHVGGPADSEVRFTFPDGKTAAGVTLGANHAVDSGLMQITEPGPWPFAPIGETTGASPGDWVVALGHPGGYDAQRPLVARLGRIIHRTSRQMRTDCTIVGGDSGGPLFDLHGRVIAIHSRISDSVAENYHVPIYTYLATWDRLAGKEQWGGGRSRAWIGAGGFDHPQGCMLERVSEDGPASKAGLLVGDIITRWNGTLVEDESALLELVAESEPGDEVTLEVVRDGLGMGMLLTVERRRGRGGRGFP